MMPSLFEQEYVPPVPLETVPETFQVREPLAVWDIDKALVCPLVEMGLTPLEQRKLLRKYSPSAASTLSSFEMHELFVQAADSKNPLSEGMNRLLLRKFEKQAVPLRRLDDCRFCESWRTAFELGDFRAHVWAVATARSFSTETVRRVYGDIHMAMHRGMDGQTSANRRLTEALREKERNERKLGELKEEIARLRRENGRLRESAHGTGAVTREERLSGCPTEISGAESVSAAVAPAVSPITSSGALSAMPPAPAFSSASFPASAPSMSKSEALLRAENARQAETILGLQRDLAEKQMLLQSFSSILEKEACAAQDCSSCPRCGEDCPAFDLCRKRVLIVGGLTRMEKLYRSLVEENGGILDYHDGVMQGGAKQLEVNLQRADLVLCPVSCNSHGACRLVKNLAKKYRKAFHMLPNASLATVGSVLAEHGQMA